MTTTETTPIRSSRAFSLIEVMVAMTVFSMVAAGTFSVALMTRHLADQQIYENTAFSVAQGILEQVKSSEFQVVRNSARDGTTGTLRTIRASVESSNDSNIRADFLSLNTWNERHILIDLVRPSRRLVSQEDGTATLEPLADWERNDAERIPVYMRMRIRPMIAEFAPTAQTHDAITIRVDYQYEVPDRNVQGGRRWQSGSARSVMSFIPTF